MKRLLCYLILYFTTATLFAQNKMPSKPDASKSLYIVEASCGQCKFDLKGNGCDLAIRLDQKAYFVKGTNIDDHGDAHSKHGFCNTIRKAEVQGEVLEGMFVASYFKLLAVKNTKRSKL